MLASAVKINGRYGARLGAWSAKTVDVKIIATHPTGGWIATNLETRRTIRIRSAKRLVYDLDDVEDEHRDAARDYLRAIARGEFGSSPK